MHLDPGRSEIPERPVPGNSCFPMPEKLGFKKSLKSDQELRKKMNRKTVQD
jgi:hypothetical protein